MNKQEIIGRINTFLYEAIQALSKWLSEILPKVTKTWWEDCVIESLSYSQKDKAQELRYNNLLILRSLKSQDRLHFSSVYDTEIMPPQHLVAEICTSMHPEDDQRRCRSWR